ncbi:hypothetical protein [Pedobacter alpinus]|uniref:Mrr-like domain-containing protein n=1 Tax=Pedobacter alpinus TaxID=1590643 RepID=A0ABW5TNE3_9SPHI
MISPTQIRKPENWQDFEKLCKKLWGEIWECSAFIKRNGRGGQNQSGVDVYGLPKGEKQYFGIQCKGKDDYSKSKLSEKEIDLEIEKARKFTPPLNTLIFATTADKDVKIEEYIRKKNIENIENGLFNIDIASWSDIVDLLEERRSTFNWYINNCQYKDASDISVLFGDEEEIEIHPKYIKTSKIYRLKREIDYSLFPDWVNPEHPFAKQLASIQKLREPIYSSPFDRKKRKIDHRWCSLPFKIYNTGSTVIEDYKLLVRFDRDKVEEIDDKFRSFSPGPLYNQTLIVAENAERIKNRQVFQSSAYYNHIEFIPTNKILVQEDIVRFDVSIIPKDNVEEIEVTWVLKSRDFKKEGKLKIKITPHYEENREIIEVESIEELKDNELIITPKTTEE